MQLLQIDGAAMPAPTRLNVQLEDARFSARQTLSGATHVSRAAVKHRVTIFWAYLPADELSHLLTAATAAPMVSLTFPDPLTGAMLQITAVSTARQVGLERMRGDVPVWTNVEMTFTEC